MYVRISVHELEWQTEELCANILLPKTFVKNSSLVTFYYSHGQISKGKH